jgi:hypothetical protein
MYKVLRTTVYKKTDASSNLTHLDDLKTSKISESEKRTEKS